MTNFSSYKRKKEIITPENSLLFIPIVMSIIFLTLLLTIVYRPLIKKLNNEEAQIKILNEKISYIPIYKKYIKDQSENINKAKNQQSRLIEIISDPQELNTILSEINRISINNSIEILNVVPSKNNIKGNSHTNSNIIFDKTSIKDSFSINSIKEHKFKLSLKGEFNNLLNFLKELEILQSIAITDNIEINPASVNAQNDKFKLIMDFDLSTYAKVNFNKLKTIP